MQNSKQKIAKVSSLVKVYQVPLPLSAPNFRRHLSSALFFDKLSVGNKCICKVERLNVKQRRS